MRSINLKKKITQDGDCYVIAEIGHNHQGSIDLCKKMFLEAKKSSADAVKIQKRDNKNLYTDIFYNSEYQSENSYGKTYGLHREALEFNKDQYIELKEYANSIGLVFFATPFDIASVDFLEDLEMPFYKIASADITNTPLIEYIAKKNKPIILSTGGSTLEDIDRAVNCILPFNKELAILQCSSCYPARPENINLNFIKVLLERYPNNIIGYSSHDNGIVISIGAYLLGARIIEKHFTIDRTLKGTDHAMSLEPGGFLKLVNGLKKVKLALGDGKKIKYPEEEKPILKMQKKIVASKKISKGKIIKIEDLAFKSPGDGIAPYKINEVIGSISQKDFEKDEAIEYEYIKKILK
jgi:sialic acid synthase